MCVHMSVCYKSYGLSRRTNGLVYFEKDSLVFLFYLPLDGFALLTSFFSLMGSVTVVVTDFTLALVGGL